MHVIVNATGAATGALFLFDGWERPRPARDDHTQVGLAARDGRRARQPRLAGAWSAVLALLARISRRPPIFENLDELLRADPPRYALLRALGARSAAFLALRVADQWVGLVVLTWPVLRTFRERDLLRFRATVAQSAVVVNGRLLYEQEHRRVSQLAMLARLEKALSKTRSDEDVVAAVLNHLGLGDAYTVSLSHLHVGAGGVPQAYEFAALWSGDQMRSVTPQVIPLNANALTAFWLGDPDALVCVADAFDDPRVRTNCASRPLKTAGVRPC